MVSPVARLPRHFCKGFLQDLLQGVLTATVARVLSAGPDSSSLTLRQSERPSRSFSSSDYSQAELSSLAVFFLTAIVGVLALLPLLLPSLVLRRFRLACRYRCGRCCRCGRGSLISSTLRRGEISLLVHSGIRNFFRGPFERFYEHYHIRLEHFVLARHTFKAFSVHIFAV